MGSVGDMVNDLYSVAVMVNGSFSCCCICEWVVSIWLQSALSAVVMLQSMAVVVAHVITAVVMLQSMAVVVAHLIPAIVMLQLINK